MDIKVTMDESETFDSIVESFYTRLLKQGKRPSVLMVDLDFPTKENPWYNLIVTDLNSKEQCVAGIHPDPELYKMYIKKEMKFQFNGYEVMWVRD